MNFLSKLNEDKDKVPGILAGVAGTLPVALAIGYSWRKMQSNQPLSASQILGNRSPLGDLGRDIGKGLHESYNKESKAVEKITEKLLKSDELAKIMEKQEQRKAIVQTILETINDPSAGLSGDALRNTRDQLMKIASDDMDSPEAREIIKAALTSIQEGGSDLTQKKFANRFREFKKVGNSFASPVAEFKSTQALNVIEHARMKNPNELLNLVGNRAGSAERVSALQSQYSRLTAALKGQNLATALEVVEMDSGMGQRALMARVYSGAGEKRKFAFQVNLLANSTGMDAPTLYPIGEHGQTRYFGPKGVAEYADVAKLNAERKHKWGLGDLRRTEKLKSVESREMDIALSLLEQDDFGVRMSKAARAAYTEQRTEILESASRVLAPGMKPSVLQDHLMKQARINQNRIVVSGLHGKTEAEKEALGKGAFSVDDGVKERFEAGGTRFSAPVDGRQYLNLQLQEGSAFSGLRTGVAKNRITLPVIARIEQAVGRNGMYINRQSTVRKMGRYSNYDVGPGGAPIGWREQHTGGVNKLGFFDATGGKGKGFLAKSEGSGMSWAPGGMGILLDDTTIPVLDAKKHDLLTTDFMAHLEEEFKAGMGMGTYSVTDNGKLRHATSGKEWDRWLGQGPNGNRRIHLDPQTRSFQIGIAEKSEVAGKSQISLAIISEREMASGKVFSPYAKATHVTPEQGFGGRLEKHYGIGRDFFARHGINLTDTISASGDQYKKAPEFLSAQLVSTYGFLDAPGVDPFDFVEKGVKAHGKKAAPFGGGNIGVAADIVMGKLAEGYKAGRIHSQDVGGALTLLYQGSGLARMHDPSGQNSGDVLWKKLGLDAGALEKRMIHHFGEDVYRNQLVPQMSTGLVLHPLTLFPGQAHGDWGLGRGSVEPRFLELTSGKLREAGMNNADVSEFMVNILKRKIGGEEGLKLVAPLERMQGSVLGRPSPVTTGATFTLDELVGEMTKLGEKTKGKANFSDFLDLHKDGINLDLGDRSNKAKAAISQAAGEHLGGQRSIYFAGADAKSLMMGTEIKQAGGTAIQIGSDYDRTVNHFVENLMKMATDNEAASSSAAKSMQEFRKNVTTLFSAALVGTARGKVKGATFSVAETLFDDLAMTPEQFKLAQKLHGDTHGQAMFRDTASFMTTLSDWMGNDKGKLAKMYFTGTERAVATGKVSTGIWSMSTRNPQLFRRSTNIVQAFRDPRQVARGESDVAFSRIKKFIPEALEELANKTQTKIGGFADIAGLNNSAHGNAIDRFFNTIANKQSQWWHSEGGGVDSYLRSEFDIKLSDTKGSHLGTIGKVDFGFQGAAYQDNDGDQPQNMILDEEDRVKLNKAFKDKERAAKYFVTDAEGIAQQKIADEYLKKSIRRETPLAKLDDGVSPELQQMSEDYLKEKAQDRSTGKVNNAVDRVRRALLNNAQGNEANVNEAMAFINTLPEQTTIKSKQRTNYEALAEMLSSAIGRTYEGESEALPNLFKTTLYPQDLMPELYQGVKFSVQGGSIPGNVKGAVGEVNLTRVLDTIMTSVQNHIAIGGGEMDTEGGLIRSLMGAAGGVNYDRYLEGKSGVQSGIAAGGGRGAAQDAAIAAEGAFARVRAAAGKIDGRMVGIATLGLGAGAAILGMAGADGYDSEPLMAPGDMPSSYVQKEIGSFNLLDSSPAREQGSPMSDPYDMMNRPVNTGATYMNRPNGYNIRGEIGTMGGVSQVGGYINNLTRGFGRGSIMVNDTRRPITSSYVDRMAGEY